MQKYSKIDIPQVVNSLFNNLSEQPHDCPEDAEDIEFITPDKTRLTCRLFLAEENAPTLLYFHDSLESIGKYDAISKNYTCLGINILLASYRGVGKNSGKPGIRSVIEDANFCFQETIRLFQKRKFAGPLFVMGRSLGSACAIDIAYNFADSTKGVIIESGFCDTIPFLNGLGADIPAGITEDDGFNNRVKIEKIQLPTLIFHGSRDTLVPPAMVETLQASSGARNKQFHIIPGADRETMIETGGDLYFQTIKTFIDTVCGVNTWRQRRKKFHKK